MLRFALTAFGEVKTGKGQSMKALLYTIGTLSVLLLGTSTGAAPRVAMEEFMLPAVDPGITLYVRNKHPVTMKTVPAEKIVLYVHGATYPAESTFDLTLNGLSWMDYIARSEEHTSELQSQSNLVCRLLLEKKKKTYHVINYHV